MAINAGPSRAAKILQEVVGCVPDGGIGPITLRCVNEYSGDLIEAYSNARADFYRSLSQFDKFGRGWLNRVEHGRAIARELV